MTASNGRVRICRQPPLSGLRQPCWGGRLRLPTLTGNALLKIPRGTQSHTLFRLRGQGMPFLNADNRGDLLVKVIVADSHETDQ